MAHKSKNIFLYFVSFVFATTGLGLMGEDTGGGWLAVVLAILTAPITWSTLKKRLSLNVATKHKTIAFIFVLGLFVLFADDPIEKRLSPSEPYLQNEASVAGTKTSVETKSSTTDLASSYKIHEQTESKMDSADETVFAKKEDRKDDKTVKIASVVDGDTVKIIANDGETETLRLIGIDTPETVHPAKPVECFGREATAKARKLLQNQTVTIQTDQTQGTKDKYGRQLVYVVLSDGRDFGEIMIRSGYAYEYTYDLPYKKQQVYKASETKARDGGVGLWSKEACADFDKASVLSPDREADSNFFESTTGESNSSCVIKGNISTNTGEKIYHLPNQHYYSKTVISEDKGERWFCTEEEARVAGWRKSLQ